MIQFYLIALLMLMLTGGILMKPLKPGFATVKFLLITVLSIVVVLAYVRLGKIGEWHQAKITEEEVIRLSKELQTPEKVIKRLRERLAEEPDSRSCRRLVARLCIPGLRMRRRSGCPPAFRQRPSTVDRCGVPPGRSGT